jgi:uncharacterized protein involved in propanediol utilization
VRLEFRRQEGLTELRFSRDGSAQDRSGPQPAVSKIGVGYAPAHHGELLQGAFLDETGRPCRALVTLPNPGCGSWVNFYPSQDGSGVVVAPEYTKVRRAAELALREFSAQPTRVNGGRVEISSNVPWGVGMGSSTSDVTATIRAIANFHDVLPPPEKIGQLAILAESASDPIMIDDRVVLFAHRDGNVLETLGHRLPPMVVVGCDTAPGCGGIETLSVAQARYTDEEIRTFASLRVSLRQAIATGDVGLLGRVATASAQINQRILPTRHLDPLLELCHSNGGCGVQIAHSGTVAGVIFDPQRRSTDRSVANCVSQIKELGLTVTTVIET